MKNKHLKAPVLSTGFSENEKSAKKRFSNILNKKGSVGVAVVIILIVLVIIVGAFISINNKTNVISSNVSGDTKNSGEKEQTETINVEKQIDVIMNNIDTWNLSTDEDIYAPYGYAITGIQCREAILESEDGFSAMKSIPRDKLIRTQTPQTFKLGNILKVHEEAKIKGIKDSVASCTLIAEVGGREMHIVPGSEKNIKITTVEDLEILKALIHTTKDEWLK